MAVVASGTRFEIKVVGDMRVGALLGMLDRPGTIFFGGTQYDDPVSAAEVDDVDLAQAFGYGVDDGMLSDIESAVAAAAFTLGNEVAVEIVDVAAHHDVSGENGVDDLPRMEPFHLERGRVVDEKEGVGIDFEIAEFGQEPAFYIVEEVGHRSSLGCSSG